MRVIRPIIKYPLFIFLGICVYTLWIANQRSGNKFTGDPHRDVTAQGSWFPSMRDRVIWGFPDTWKASNASDITGIPDSEVLDPIAERTFYMLKTGADVMWDRLPIHLETTLKRFPYHQIYGDTSSVIGDESIVDVIDMIPEAIITEHIAGYTLRKQQLEESWGWNSRQIKKDGGDGWNTDKYKNVPMMLHAYRNAPKHIDWFVFADDDTFIHTQSLRSLLHNLNPKDKHYIGSPAVITGGFAETGKVGQRLKAAKPAETVILWFAHGGSSVIVSRGALDALFWDPQREDDLVRKYSESAVQTCCGDAVFAYMLREELELYINKEFQHGELSVDPFQGERLETTQISVSDSGFCSRLLSWHHLDNWEIQKLYEWEQSLMHRKSNTQAGVLYSDVYHDFILPFLSTSRDDWDNGADTLAGEGDSNPVVVKNKNSDSDDLIYPAGSPADCMRVCRLNKECLGWKFQYKSVENQCFFETKNLRKGIHRSSTDEPGTADPKNKVVSGWLMDRIRVRRSSFVCDNLKWDPNAAIYSDTEDESEGWYLRKLEAEQNGALDRPVL